MPRQKNMPAATAAPMEPPDAFEQFNAQVGFENMGRLLSQPVADHALIEGYAVKIESYLKALADRTQQPL